MIALLFSHALSLRLIDEREVKKKRCYESEWLLTFGRSISLQNRLPDRLIDRFVSII